MNFSSIEDAMLDKKSQYSYIFSFFYKHSRILIIILLALIITTISFSFWSKSSGYQVLYKNLSNEERVTVINQLNEMNIPYKFTEGSSQLLVPIDKIYDIRLHLAEKNIPNSATVGFELLDQEKFGISQFNENINYHRALEGELARTIQRIKIVRNARIHIAFPKSSLFLEEQKSPSASLILDLEPGQLLDSNQINAILHLISSSIFGLSIDNITIIDQYGRLLNHPDLGNNQINNFQLNYIHQIENHYQNRIQNILEPLVGKNNVYAQVTAQIDFNIQENTQEKYSPNTNFQDQSIRSLQKNIHTKIDENTLKKDIPSIFSNTNPIEINHKKNLKQIDTVDSLNNDTSSLNNISHPTKSNINHESTINYELNHTISHTKIHTGDIKRLSAAVVVNFIKNENGKYVPLSKEQKKNLHSLVCEAIGCSKNRGDSIKVLNSLFFKNTKKILFKKENVNNFILLDYLISVTLWLILVILLFFIFKKYFSVPKKNINSIIQEKEIPIKKMQKAEENKKENIKKDLNIDQLIHNISNISNQNPRTIALIIRQWMSDKK